MGAEALEALLKLELKDRLIPLPLTPEREPAEELELTLLPIRLPTWRRILCLLQILLPFLLATLTPLDPPTLAPILAPTLTPLPILEPTLPA